MRFCRLILWSGQGRYYRYRQCTNDLREPTVTAGTCKAIVVNGDGKMAWLW